MKLLIFHTNVHINTKIHISLILAEEKRMQFSVVGEGFFALIEIPNDTELYTFIFKLAMQHIILY